MASFKRSHRFAAVAFFLSFGTLAASLPVTTTTFLGTPGPQLINEENWSNGFPSAANPGLIDRDGVFNSGPGAGWVVVHTAGRLNSGFNRVFGGGTVWYMTGGEVFFYSEPNDAFRNWNGGSGGYTLNISGGTFDVAVIQVTFNSVLNLSGGTMTMRNNLNANTGTINLLAGDGVITTPNMSNSDGTVNAFTGWTGSLTVTSWTQAQFEERWDSGILTFEGSNAGSFGDFFEVDGATLRLRTGEPPSGGYAAWIAGSPFSGDDALPGSAPRGDGLPNLYIYSQGGDASVANSVARPLIEAGANVLNLHFRRIADPDLLYTVWSGSTLNAGDATPIWTSTGVENVAGPVTVSAPAASPTRFLWLSVEVAP